MKPTRPLFAAFAAFLTALPAFAADKVEQWITLAPKDTVLAIALKDTPELLADWDNSAFGKFMQDEEAKRWLEPMKEDGVMPWDKYFNDIYGTGLYDTLKEGRGTTMAFLIAKDAAAFEKNELGFIAFSEVGDNETRLIDQKKQDFEHDKKEHPEAKVSTEDIQGVTVNISAESDAADAKWEDAYAVVDGVMIEASNRENITYAIAALKSGSGDAPAEIREHFGRLSQLREGVADITIYANGTRILDLAKEGIANAEKKEDKKKAAPNPMGDIKPEQIIEAIGLHELKGIAITLDFADDRTRSDVAILHSEKPAGFLSWVQTDAKDVELPAFIADDVASGQVSRVEWLKLYDGIMGMVTKLSPQMGMMANMYLGGFEQQNGFKIRDDLFGSLANENFQVQDGDGKTQSNVMGLKIKNAEKLGTALKGIQNALGGMGFAAFEESDYLGYKLNTFKMSTVTPAAGAPAAEIAYVNTGKYLLIGSGSLDALRKTLGRMKDPSGGSIWETPRAQAQMALLPKGFSGLGIADSSKMISILFNAMEMVSKQAATQKKSATKKKGPGKGPAKDDPDADKPADASGEALAKFVDSKNRPSDATFQNYFGTLMSATYSHPDAQHLQMLSTPVEAK
jgi:hypothetical protein